MATIIAIPTKIAIYLKTASGKWSLATTPKCQKAAIWAERYIGLKADSRRRQRCQEIKTNKGTTNNNL